MSYGPLPYPSTPPPLVSHLKVCITHSNPTLPPSSRPSPRNSGFYPKKLRGPPFLPKPHVSPL